MPAAEHAGVRRLLIPVLALAVLAGCQPRQPLDRGRVWGLADNLLLHEGLAWGTPLEFLEPAEIDAGGRGWWQVRYPAGERGERVVLVDGESGWARLPWPGYVVRVAPRSPFDPRNPLVVDPGPALLVVTPPETPTPAREGELAREANRLNALAAETGLYPAFALRALPAGGQAIVYGWQGDRGIRRDERVREWLALRTPYVDGAWLEPESPPR